MNEKQPSSSTARVRSSSTAAVVLLNAVTLASQAQEPAEEPQPAAANASTNAPTQLPEVLVEAVQEPEYNPQILQSPRYTEPLRDIPQVVTVIPRAVIEEQNATSLRDILRNVPGISIQAGEGGGGVPGDNPTLRGFTSRSSIFVDGIRDYASYTRDPFNIEQVEVSKGPSSSYSGRAATGGSINLVSKTPRLRPLYGGSLGFGTDDYKRATIDVNQPLQNDDGTGGVRGAALRLNALWHDAETPGRNVVSEERWGIAPSLAFGLGTPTRVTLSYFHMTQDNVPDYGIPWVPDTNVDPVLSNYINQAPPVDYDNFYGLRNYDYEDVRTDLGTIQLEHDFSDSLRLRDVLRYGRNYRDHAITAPRFADTDPAPGTQTTTVINRNLQRREYRHEVFANMTDLVFEFETGPVDHTLVSGLELAYEDQFTRNSASAGTQPQTDIYNPNPNDPHLGPVPGITGARTDGKATTIALYAFDTLQLTEKWQINGGVRWDHVRADVETPTDDFDRTDDMASYRGALVFKPVENGSIYFGYGTSFDASLDGNIGLALAANTADLDPEESQTFELGTKWDFFSERLSLSAAIFRTEKTNARTPGLLPGDPPLVLDGEHVVEGIELGAAGSITEDWRVIAGYTHLSSEITASNTEAEIGQALAHSPKHSWSLWTTYQLPAGFIVGAGGSYVDDRKNNVGANQRVAPSYTVWDAMIGYEVNENVSLRLNVYNLADKRYIDRVGGGHFIPGPGRSAVLTASVRF